MSRLRSVLVFTVAIGGFGAWALASPPEPDLGSPLSPAELSRFVAIPPSGANLPHGRGGVAEGKVIYTERCAACHGEHLEGVKDTGGLPLIGGRGTLATAKPLKTVESYWPYATTLFDYVRRAMPFNAPGSLTDDEVYAVSAYLLSSGHVIAEDAVLDEVSLPKVDMPNQQGFYRDPRAK
jgi:hypothetical protein